MGKLHADISAVSADVYGDPSGMKFSIQTVWIPWKNV